MNNVENYIITTETMNCPALFMRSRTGTKSLSLGVPDEIQMWCPPG
jgi:hypothetical protein